MKITLLTYGSRGDVQPFLALAVGLQRAGHRVKLAAPYRFKGLVSAYHVPFDALAGDPEVISRRLNDAGANPIRMVHAISNYVFSIADQVVNQAFSACKDADVIVHSFLFTTGGHAFARRLGVPDVSIQSFPVFAPTRAFPPVFMPKALPGLFSYFLHWLAIQTFWYGGNLGYRSLRKVNPEKYDLDMRWPFTPKKTDAATPLIFAYSQTVVARPDDWSTPNIYIPGYLFLDFPKTYKPPDELVDFLASGSPPICVTFGSMIHRDSAKIYRVVLDALEISRERVIILSGWSELSCLGEMPSLNKSSGQILMMDAVPHDWLFPRCKAIIHHGGAGTTGAGLRAGVPNLVIPFAADQPFWGARVHAIGAGPQPVPVKMLTTEKLVAALAEGTGNVIRKGAHNVGCLIREEDGVGEVVRIIELAVAQRHIGANPPIF